MIPGEGGAGYPGLPGILADPPTQPLDQKDIPQVSNEIYGRIRKMEAEFRYTNFFVASAPPSQRMVSTSH